MEGYFVEHVLMRECSCSNLMGCPKKVNTLIYTKEEHDRLMLDFPCMTVTRDEWADRNKAMEEAKHHPAIEMIRLLLEKYENLERSDRDILCKAILALCQTPVIVSDRSQTN